MEVRSDRVDLRSYIKWCDVLNCECDVSFHAYDVIHIVDGVQSSKSRPLSCLIGKTQLLWTQCRGIGPHLEARGKSHGFSRVAAGTWSIFSIYGTDVHSKLQFVQ